MKAKFLITLALAVLVSSCYRVKDLGTFDLTNAQKQVIPYEKGQVISFIDSTGRSIDLTVTESELFWNQGRPNDEGWDYYHYRVKTATLKSAQNSKISFVLMIDAYNCFEEDYCKFEVAAFSFNVDVEGNFLTGTFHDSIEINNKVYYDVIEAENTYPNPTQLFYNKTYGILQFKKDVSGIFLTLNN
ncbi:MAG: hypothetical protein LBV75_02935 [Paludibacter sp.]|jgi:hypothetical protein|nr:hypothetical protein [Paludibacter sp.]